ncbi:MAG: hypothetical protein XU12_C0001G0131 [Deltaproteobacteria bacterium CSP1-8]|jgi:hypothetical protein|nr:MAG: hypothetical protein XU12_C0001G0131 [Deltaproteobacteria bacterium CSP1-8]
MKPAVALAVLLLVAAARGFAGEPSGGVGSGNEPLRMEELEVRGLREKAEVLYLPSHRGIALPSPVRYDLFLEDMKRPVFHRGLLPGTTQTD